MPKNDMIDADFLDEGDLEGLDEGGNAVAGFESDSESDIVEGKSEGNSKGKQDKIEIDIVDDTPEPDKGKRVAKDDDVIDEDDDAKAYSKSVQKRIAKETAKAHAERRRAEERERQLNEAIQHIQRLTKDKNSLLGTLESGEKVLVGEHKGRLAGMLEQAKAKYREAHEAGDVNAIVAAQEAMARAAAQIEQAERYVSQQLQREDENLHTRIAQQQKPQVDPAALAWAEKNKWWGKDEGMTAYAMALHRRVVAAGIEASSDDYYNSIDTEMRKRFPEKFSAEKPRRSGTVVAAPTRTIVRDSGSPRKVTLTGSQVKLARRLGLTNEQYARQVLAQGDGNEFTHTTRS